MPSFSAKYFAAASMCSKASPPLEFPTGEGSVVKEIFSLSPLRSVRDLVRDILGGLFEYQCFPLYREVKFQGINGFPETFRWQDPFITTGKIFQPSVKMEKQ